jgi:hypothetical protein
MEMFLDIPERPNVSFRQECERELVKRIRKLRWIGKEDEARRLQAALVGRTLAECVLPLPVDTD